jgi:UDP-glucose 4-epimerase
VTKRKVPVRINGRRPGDPPLLVANCARAKEVLGFSPQFSALETIIETAWSWHNRRHNA